MTNETIFMNRELSWLKFNERVLEEAESEKNPLCERLTFASIYQSNLDEFFMVRVGSLIDQMIVSKNVKDNKTGMTAKEQIQAILARVAKLNRRKDTVYENLMDEVAQAGIRLVDFRKIGKKEGKYLEQYFDAEIAPLISPIVVGKRQPFPFLKNKGIYAVVVLEKKNGKEKLGIIPCNSGVFPRLVQVPGEEETYMLAEELILHFISKVFKGYFVKAKSLIRVTRNADIDADALYDEDLDYRDFMEGIIKKRKRLLPVRVEFSRELDGDIVDKICEYLDLDGKYVFRGSSPLDLSFVFQIQDSLRNHPELFYEKRVPQKSTQIDSKRSILEQIKEKDKLLSYPYESMDPFLRMIKEAAYDPTVLTIRITIYRLAKKARLVEYLCAAAENGKEVTVLIELRARFDEQNNIDWSERLEEAGCRVIYGFEGYKVHSKICLITYRNRNNIEYITQVGTGNYNEKTATMYTDVSLITADKGIGEDAAVFFKNMSIGNLNGSYQHIIVSPTSLKPKVLSLMDEEIKKGTNGRIIMKMNSVTDVDFIQKVSEASNAGVKVDLIVRGICCILPGVKGYTENLRVTSIVGRYLEHPRIFLFGTGADQKIYIGSADMMTRNTEKRVEVACPVYDETIRKQLTHMLKIMLADNVKARELKSDGKYYMKEKGTSKVNSQEYFMREAITVRHPEGRTKQSFVDKIRKIFRRK